MERHKKTPWVRLLTQVNESQQHYNRDIPGIRSKAYQKQLSPLIRWNCYERDPQRSWKNHRKTQYKPK